MKKKILGCPRPTFEGIDAVGKPAIVWTQDAWAIHSTALRDADLRFSDALREADIRHAEERDRRYAETVAEREKALKIKETADLTALTLARESQTYKEQQVDLLRDKNLSESGSFATNASVNKIADEIRNDVAKQLDGLTADLKQLITGAAGQTGLQQGSQLSKANLYSAVATLGVIGGLLVVVLKVIGA